MNLPRGVNLTEARNIEIALELAANDMGALAKLRNAAAMLAQSYFPDASKGEGLWRRAQSLMLALRRRALIKGPPVIQGGS